MNNSNRNQENGIKKMMDFITSQLPAYHVPETKEPVKFDLSIHRTSKPTVQYHAISRVYKHSCWEKLDHVISNESFEHALDEMWAKMEPAVLERAERENACVGARLRLILSCVWQEALRVAKEAAGVAGTIGVKAATAYIVGSVLGHTEISYD